MANIHHITPSRADKNLGLAINSIVKELPIDDWVIVRDTDTLILDGENFNKQCQQIADSSQFDLVGCMTGRIGMKEQLYKGNLSLNRDIQKEIDIAKICAAKGFKVVETNETIAGFFMMFPVYIWDKVGGFREGKIIAPDGSMPDYDFSMKVKKSGGKLGICQSLYLFHLYRFGKDPRSREGKRHLI